MPPPPQTAATAWPLEPGKDRTVVRLLEFVEVRDEGTLDEPEILPNPALITTPAELRWSLWGEAEA
jgi:hypothetical protein